MGRIGFGKLGYAYTEGCMNKKTKIAQNPLILRFNRLMDVFTKSDDERDFYFDKIEGFLIYLDLNKSEQEILLFENELEENPDRYLLVPKMTFYEVKKFMENFIHEKVYDIDTKEKLLDLVSARESRENFLEFIYDQLTELEKWQLYYQERSRIRIIEWLRNQELKFVFEEDLELSKEMIEKLKRYLFDEKVPKDITTARNVLVNKSKIYYSSEALNPRPKRGRPPKQSVKTDVETEFAIDIYTTIPVSARPFLYIPDIASAASVTFSAKFESEDQLLASLRGNTRIKVDERLEALSERLESLRHMTDRLGVTEGIKGVLPTERPISSSGIKKAAVASSEKKRAKISSAIEDVLPLRGKKIPVSEEAAEEFIGEKRKRFAIKKVTPIKKKKPKGG